LQKKTPEFEALAKGKPAVNLWRGADAALSGPISNNLRDWATNGKGTLVYSTDQRGPVKKHMPE